MKLSRVDKVEVIIQPFGHNICSKILQIKNSDLVSLAVLDDSKKHCEFERNLINVDLRAYPIFEIFDIIDVESNEHFLILMCHEGIFSLESDFELHAILLSIEYQSNL